MDVKFTTQSGRSPIQVVDVFVNSVKPTVEEMEDIGKWLAGKVRERTLTGVGFDDAPFAAYSPAYAAEKGSSIVDLYSAARTGKGAQMDLFEYSPNHMLDSLEQRLESDSPSEIVESVGLYDSPATARRGRWMQEGWQSRAHVGKRFKKGKRRGQFLPKPKPVPPRPWLGASEEDKTYIRDTLGETVTARLDGLLHGR